MNAIKTTWVPFVASLGLLVACGASQDAAMSAQEPVPGTTTMDGVTAQQSVADEQVVERISAARCDRDQSCDRIGRGAIYRDRDDCMKQTRVSVMRDLNPSSCPGGIGEAGLNRCVRSIEAGACDTPGQIVGQTSHCHLSALCMKR